MLWTHLLWTTLSHLIGVKYCGHCLWLTFPFVNQAIPRKLFLCRWFLDKNFPSIVMSQLLFRYLWPSILLSAILHSVNLNLIVVWNLFGPLLLDIGFDYNAHFLANVPWKPVLPLGRPWSPSTPAGHLFKSSHICISNTSRSGAELAGSAGVSTYTKDSHAYFQRWDLNSKPQGYRFIDLKIRNSGSRSCL